MIKNLCNYCKTQYSFILNYRGVGGGDERDLNKWNQGKVNDSNVVWGTFSYKGSFSLK